VRTIASHCTRIPKDGSVIHSARGTEVRVTGSYRRSHTTQQPCGLTGRFELNGEMSRTDVASDSTPYCMNPNGIRRRRSGSKSSLRLRSSLVAVLHPIISAQINNAAAADFAGRAISVRFSILCRLGTVRLMSVTRAKPCPAAHHREHHAHSAILSWCR